MSGLWTTAFGLVVSVIIVGAMLVNTSPSEPVNFAAAAIAIPAVAWTGKALLGGDDA